MIIVLGNWCCALRDLTSSNVLEEEIVKMWLDVILMRSLRRGYWTGSKQENLSYLYECFHHDVSATCHDTSRQAENKQVKVFRGYYPNYLYVYAMPLSFVRHNDLPT